MACFQPINRRVESELLENFQDIDFEDLEQQQVGFQGMYLSIGLHASNFIRIVGIHVCHTFP
jgi:hypothetical protein